MSKITIQVQLKTRRGSIVRRHPSKDPTFGMSQDVRLESNPALLVVRKDAGATCSPEDALLEGAVGVSIETRPQRILSSEARSVCHRKGRGESRQAENDEGG